MKMNLSMKVENNKPKFDPKLHTSEMIFIRRGFVDQDVIKKKVETGVVLTENGTQYRNDQPQNDKNEFT